jgi:transporter family-2 protein
MTLAFFSYLLFAIVVGFLIPIQPAINAQLSKLVSGPVQSSFLSFLIGFIVLFIILLCSSLPFPKVSQISSINPLLLIGGVLGVIFVFSSMWLIPKIGAAPLSIAIICGQLLMSLLIDHYGLFDLERYPLSWSRILGCAFVCIGLLLVIKKA